MVSCYIMHVLGNAAADHIGARGRCGYSSTPLCFPCWGFTRHVNETSTPRTDQLRRRHDGQLPDRRLLLLYQTRTRSSGVGESLPHADERLHKATKDVFIFFSISKAEPKADSRGG